MTDACRTELPPSSVVPSDVPIEAPAATVTEGPWAGLAAESSYEQDTSSWRHRAQTGLSPEHLHLATRHSLQDLYVRRRTFLISVPLADR